MAKGQKRGNREVKKPKAAVVEAGRRQRRLAIPAPHSPFAGEGRRQMRSVLGSDARPGDEDTDLQ